MRYILAIDLGGTKIAAGLINRQNKILNKKVEPIFKNISQNQLIALIKRISQQVLVGSGIKKRDLKAIGIAAPGPLDSKKGVIFFTPNLPKTKNFKIVAALRREFQKPVFLENDAKAAAAAEWKYGAGRGTRNMIYLTISTGIGGGIIINSQLYRGMGQAGEIGHMIIDPTGSRCGCGQKGCLEALASGTAIAREAKKRYKKIKGIKELRKIDSQWVFQAARKRDKLAKKIIQESLTALAAGLVNLVHIFQPEKIVLGGGVMKNKEMILPVLRKLVAKKIMTGFRKPKIVAAKLGDESGLVGLGISGFKR